MGAEFFSSFAISSNSSNSGYNCGVGFGTICDGVGEAGVVEVIL
jgi:hypothetical protein